MNESAQRNIILGIAVFVAIIILFPKGCAKRDIQTASSPGQEQVGAELPVLEQNSLWQKKEPEPEPDYTFFKSPDDSQPETNDAKHGDLGD